MRAVHEDRPIFQAALVCRATHLLTGDLKDFGRFMNRPEATLGVRIQTVAQFLDQAVPPPTGTGRSWRGRVGSLRGDEFVGAGRGRREPGRRFRGPR